MTADKLLQLLRGRGVTFLVDGELLRCGPSELLSGDDIGHLRRLKPDLMAIIQAEQAQEELELDRLLSLGDDLWRSDWVVRLATVATFWLASMIPA